MTDHAFKLNQKQIVNGFNIEILSLKSDVVRYLL